MYLIYLTFLNKKEAVKITRLLLENKLIACANFFPCASLYSWQGKIKQSKEVILFAKTTKKNIKNIELLVKKYHSYQVPCICAYEAKKVAQDYLKWVKNSVE